MKSTHRRSLLPTTLFLLAIGASAGAQVVSFQKIDEDEGNWGGPTDEFTWLGGTLASIGDLDGDGLEDLAAGIPEFISGTGSVWILFMNADGTIRQQQEIGSGVGGFRGEIRNDGFGDSVACLGDVDGDGVQDLAVGAATWSGSTSDEGSLWILFMNTDGTVKHQQKIAGNLGGFDGPLQERGFFGISCAALGDIDGDGTPDVAVGQHGHDGHGSSRGAFWILTLQPDGQVQTQKRIGDGRGNFQGVLNDGDIFGGALANLGDLDGNGVVDLAVAAEGDDEGGSGTGAVWIVFLRPNRGVLKEQKISNADGGMEGLLPPEASFGDTLAAAGDWDADGHVDLAVGSGLEDGTGEWRGAVRLLKLRTDGTVASFQRIADTRGGVEGELEDFDFFGTGLAFTSDHDGDGRPELVVGASGEDGAGGVHNVGGIYYLFLTDDQLWLEASSTTPSPGDNLALTTSAGAPDAAQMLVAVEVNGNPFFHILDFDLFGFDHTAIFTATVPPGLAGLSVDFASFGFAPSGKLRMSNVEEIVFQ